MARRSSSSIQVVSLLLAVAAICSAGGLLVPAFREAQAHAMERALDVDIVALNRAIEEYRRDHGGALPGVEGETLHVELLVRQLTLPTTREGSVLDRGACGPYLRAGVPPNPFDDVDEIHVETTGRAPSGDGSGGWCFHLPTGRFYSNARR